MACTAGSGTPTAGRLSWTGHLGPLPHPKPPANLLPAARAGRGREAIVVLAAAARAGEGCAQRRRPGEPLCARQARERGCAVVHGYWGGSQATGVGIVAAGGSPQPHLPAATPGAKGPFSAWGARFQDGHPWRARPAVAPRRPVGCPGLGKWRQVSTPHPPLIYSLPPVRGAAASLLWYSPPAPCCALQGRAPGESRARGGRCARASPPDACARAAGGSRDGLCARAPTSLQRAGRPRPLVVMEGGALLGVTAAHCVRQSQTWKWGKLGTFFHFL